MSQPLELEFQIFLEADDISQTRLLKTISFVKNLFKNCGNTYLKTATLDDESDLEDFSLRLYAENKVKEESVGNIKDAETFVQDMMEFLDVLAQAQSYAKMDGTFSINFKDQRSLYEFTSEEGKDYCDISCK